MVCFVFEFRVGNQGIEPLVERLPNHLYYRRAVSWIYTVAGVANSFLWGLAMRSVEEEHLRELRLYLLARESEDTGSTGDPEEA